MARAGERWAPRNPITGRPYSDEFNAWLEKVIKGDLSPYWRVFEPSAWTGHQRDIMERCGLAEFRRTHAGLLIGRLTDEGVRVRDYFHRRNAERIDRDRRKENRYQREIRKRKREK